MTRLPSECLLRVKDDDASSDFAPLQVTETFVHLIQRNPVRDHLIEVQAILEIQVDVTGNVDPETTRPHEGTLERLSTEESRPRDLDYLSGRDHADDRGRATSL